MARLIWTENARKDLRIIVDYISKRAPQAGRKTGAAIRSSVEILRQLPLLGSPVDDLEDGLGLREMIEGNFRVLYIFDSPNVRIVKVVRAECDLRLHFYNDDLQ